MTVSALSPTIVTPEVAAMRAFYQEHLDARIVFDCDWYVCLRLGTADGAPEVCIMAPEPAGATPFAGAGLTCNLKVDDVDAWHERLVGRAGLPATRALQDNPWGDRGFAVTDPAGVTLYFFTPIPPSPDFAGFYR